MKAQVAAQLARRKQKILKRLDPRLLPATTVFRKQNMRYELAEKSRGIVYGGVGAMVLLTQNIGLDEAINRELRLLKVHRPYTEVDHVEKSPSIPYVTPRAWKTSNWAATTRYFWTR